MKNADDGNTCQEKAKPVRAGRKKKRDARIETAFAATAMHYIAAAS